MIDIVVIGSTALYYHKNLNRHIMDFDFIAKYDDAIEYLNKRCATSILPFGGGKKLVAKCDNICEVEIAWEGSLAEELYNYVANDEKSLFIDSDISGVRMLIPSIDVLYTLKMSHRYLKNNPHFRKTMDDIHHLRSIGAKIPTELEDWFKRREQETYSYKHPNLMLDKKNFFSSDNVMYVYDHDSIHEAVAIHERPAYTYYAKDGHEVYSDKNKFFALSEEMRIAGVYEEACVLAIERSLVPFPNMKTPKDAFLLALEKVCTSITSGWFREYAWENYYKVIDFFEKHPDYYEKFSIAVAESNVKHFS